jgi:hypothetical protein
MDNHVPVRYIFIPTLCRTAYWAMPMQSSLHDHIMFLEQSIQALSDRLTDPAHTTDERKRIHSQIRDAELALAHYRKAFELEGRLPVDSD